MKKLSYLLVLLVPALVFGIVMGFGYVHMTPAKASGSTPTCTPTGYIKDGINLTAASINPAGTFSAVLNATGCNIGVYYGPGARGNVNKAEIYGANYFGVLNNGGRVTVSHSYIHDIGEVPFNGTQHGVGIDFAYNSGASGSISYNKVERYQKNGITVSGASDSATISHNTVIGQGPVNYIAQNGIEVGGGSKGDVSYNTVQGNAYSGTGDASSGGILIFGGPCYGTPFQTKTRVYNNTLTGNDVGIYDSNLATDSNGNCIAPTTATRIMMTNNTISNDAVTNVSGNYPGPGGYQAGVSDAGDFDQIQNNRICGVGYTPAATPPPFLYKIDISYANDVTVERNTSCGSKITAAPQGKSVLAQHAVVHRQDKASVVF